MPQVINTNIASLNAQRNLNKSQSSLGVSLQRLSSGTRINSARDDAAGLAISERFTSQIRGLNQSVRNANDGISLAQTAEGALSEVSNNLQRVRELAVQSANGTNSASDRQALQAEASELIAEIDRIASQTNFNGINLLDGSFGSTAFQIGADAGQTVDIAGISSAKAGDMGQYTEATVSSSGALSALTAGELTINSVGITTDDASAKGIAAAINSSGAGVTATANATASTGTALANADGDETGVEITINGFTTSGFNLGTDAATNRALVIEEINKMSAATGVVASAGNALSDGVILTAADGRNITTSYTSGAGTVDADEVGFAATTFNGTYSLTSSEAIVVAGSSVSDAGLTATTTNASLTGTSISLTDISTVNGATDAIKSVDAALNSVNSTRANLGAVQNRFDSVVASLQNTSDNLSAARSRVMDTDFATETAALTKAQILQQAGTAMLSQANALPQGVLSLLG